MPARSRGVGWGQWLGLATTCALILSLTFALGILVGRQWARQPFPPHPPVAAERPRSGPEGGAGGPGGSGRVPGTPALDPAAPAAAPARPTPAAARPDPARQDQEKLTFYRTLTAPVGPVGSAPGEDGRGSPPAPAAAAPRGRGADGPALPPPPPALRPPRPGPAMEQVAPPPALRTPRVAPAMEQVPAPKPRLAGEVLESETRWTVQVGAFRSREQAESVRRRLAGAGHEVAVTPVTAGDGLRYRVRVGSYASRTEAEQAAARVRSSGGLSTFVTPR